jgi:membrane protein DedA with SNARE-associated domain
VEGGVFSGLLNIIQSHPGWLIALACLFALLESLAIIGIFVPGIVLLFIVGAVVGMDPALFLACWLAAALGALCGDGVSYWLGRRFSDHIPRLWPLSRRPDMLAAGQTLFVRHGGKGVFIGRFIGPIRPVVPLVSGMMAMPASTFFVYAVPACLLWAPLYLLPGMLFGASLELAAEFAGRLAMVLLILVLGTWFAVWITRVIYEFTARRSTWWLKGLIRWSSDHPLLGRYLGALFEPGRREVISVAMLGLLLVVCLAVLLVVLVSAPFASHTWDAELEIAGYAASLRNHFADPVFIVLSLVGSLMPMALLAGATTILLIALGRVNAAWHWLAATAGGWLLAELLNGTMSLIVIQPDYMPSLGEVPHRGFTLVTVVLGFFAVMLAKDLSARSRKWPYLLASACLTLIGFAHFYLGMASISGLLAALTLGLGWVALVGIGYRQRAQTRRHPVVLALVFYGLAIGIGVSQASAGYAGLKASSELQLPERTFTAQAWVEHEWARLPDRLSRFGRADRARFDFQYAGDLDRLAIALGRQGFNVVEPRSPTDVIRQALLRPSLEHLPHLSKDFAGHPDDLMLRRILDDGDVVLVRLWASGAAVEPGPYRVWLGQVRMVRLASLPGGLSRWAQVDARRDQARRAFEQALDEFWQEGQQAHPIVLYAESSLAEAVSTMSSSASSR